MLHFQVYLLFKTAESSTIVGKRLGISVKFLSQIVLSWSYYTRDYISAWGPELKDYMELCKTL